MNRRKALLDNWRPICFEAGWDSCYENCFRILYGLPLQIQLELASYMMGRYLPIFEAWRPNIQWPRILINDVAKWVEEFGKSVPSHHDAFKGPDRSPFRYALHGLVEVYYYREDPFGLTSSAVYTAMSSIQARSEILWAADDPEAVEMWKNHACPRQRGSYWNVASIAVSQREWNLIGEWLKKAEVWQYPDQVDMERMEYELAGWRGNQFVLSGPLFSLKPDKKKVSLEEKRKRGLQVRKKFQELGYE
ncbi:MAG TPA: hypothetical protein DC064_26730 [Cyanobacteria bacterium UBA9273]|nr:hypothetical protein [Cyanobacteria bacterium UBA9273]